MLYMHQNRFLLTTLPMLPSRLGRGYPLPIPHPLDAFGVSFSTPSGLGLGAFFASLLVPLAYPIPPDVGVLAETLPVPLFCLFSQCTKTLEYNE